MSVDLTNWKVVLEPQPAAASHTGRAALFQTALSFAQQLGTPVYIRFDGGKETVVDPNHTTDAAQRVHDASPGK